ncbi:helix-turn-helix domain-containing protein [Bradyrhizobium sp. AUGA SZCCT0222]|uniref:helix-turn-helix transcriptional regulator n=1 Tax=Bradyrhizobium sp. AUGA SZCCT0222 TaxID=2807668 RepID=UPI001BA4F04B|nr:helix-turn-helix domain-containing protein [Bradyrhizobium sp. AUGA SZCCT0222]MBR1269063.1 helix-turn-helix domain-containing protein [Bradyrhizobium sp. AUGA SZCCT0222]
MKKVIFSSDDLSAELDDNERFKRFRELHSDLYCAFDYSRMNGEVFSARYQFSQFRTARTSQFSGTVNGFSRTLRHITKDPFELFGISFHRGSEAIRCEQIGRESIIAPGEASFFSVAEAIRFEGEARFDFTAVSVSRQNLIELVAHPDDLILDPFDPNDPTLRHLARYLDIIQESNDGSDDPSLDAHIETTLVDLIALALGARRDASEVAHKRGLRAARLQEILLAIRKAFTDPGFSSEQAARIAGVSRRYVNDLLSETGSSFAERVLELRLQKARMMLADHRNDRLKIDEVAFACGFNEVSYFHRCFRRRFGASPAQYRGSGGGDA